MYCLDCIFFFFYHFRVWPAERGVIYSVQDVIVAIQNGLSDFEMESDITEAVGEEADEDAVELDKENQQPTDCPGGD